MRTGRPPIAPQILELPAELHAQSLGYGTIARVLGIGKTTTRRACQNSQPQAARGETRP